MSFSNETVVSAAPARNRRGGRRFAIGNTEYRARRDRVAKRLAELQLDFDPTPSTTALLSVVAKLLDDADKARTTDRRVRAANTANRILRTLQRRVEPALPVSLDEYLDGLEGSK